MHFQAGGGGKTAQRIPVPSWPLNVRPDCGRLRRSRHEQVEVLQASVRRQTRQSQNSSLEAVQNARTASTAAAALPPAPTAVVAAQPAGSVVGRGVEAVQISRKQTAPPRNQSKAERNPYQEHGSASMFAESAYKAQERLEACLERLKKPRLREATGTAAAKPTAAAAANTTPLDPPSMTAWTGRW